MTDFDATITNLEPIPEGTGKALPQGQPAEVSLREAGLSDVQRFMNEDVAIDLQGIPDADLSVPVPPAVGVTGEPLDENASEVDVLQPAINEILAMDLALGTKNDLILEARKQYQKDNRLDQKALQDLALAESTKDLTRWQESRSELLRGEVQDSYDIEKAIATMNEEVKGLKDGGVLNTVSDFALAELVGWVSKPINNRQLLEKMFDVEASLLDNISSAGLAEKAQENWRNLTADEQKRRLAALPAVIKDIQSFAGDNDFDIESMTQLVNGIVGNTEDFEGMQSGLLIEPLVNIVTSGVVAGGFKVGTRALKAVARSEVPKFSVAGMLANTAPRAAQDALRSGAEDVTGAEARKVGTDRESIIIDHVAPKGEEGIDAVTRGPDLNMGALSSEAESLIEETLKLSVDEGLFLKQGAEQAAKDAHGSLARIMKDHADNGTVDLSKSRFFQNDRGELVAQYVIKNEDGLEFGSAAEALDYLGRHFPDRSLDKVTLLKRSSKGEYLPHEVGNTAENLDRPGAFYVRAEYVDDVSTSGTGDSLFRPGVSVGFATNMVDTAGSYSAPLAGALSRASVVASKIKAQSDAVLKPFSKLPAGSQSKVDRVLREGEQELVWYSDRVLMKKFSGNRGLVDAYKAVRLHREWDMALEEVALRRELVSDGYRYLRSPSGNLLVRRSSDRKTSAYDSVTGTFRSLDEGEEAYSLLRPKLVQKEGGEEVVVRRIIRGTSDKLPEDIPANFIGRTPGDLGRHVNTDIRVKQRIKDSRGEVVEKTVRVANNPSAAARFIDNEVGDADSYFVSTFDSTARLSPTDDRLSVLDDLGMLGNPGQPQMGWNTVDLTARKHLPSLDEALARSRNKIGDIEATRQITEYMINSMERQFGDILENGRMNFDGRQRWAPGSNEQVPRRKLAQALQTKIKLVSGMDEGYLSSVFRDRLMEQAEYFAYAATDLSRKGSKGKLSELQKSLMGTTADALYQTAKGAPLQKAKDAVQAAYIVMYPIRQGLLNAATSTVALGVNHGPSYLASGAMGRDMAFLGIAKGMKDLSPGGFEAALENYAKLSGVTTKEARAFYDELFESGLIDSVSSHQYLQHSGFNASGVLPNSTRRVDDAGAVDVALGTGADALRAGRSLAQKGFSIGETINLTASYLLVRNRALKAAGTKSLTESQRLRVVAEAKQLTGNMDSVNKSVFQTGGAGLIFQFMSHTMKMTQLILPSAAGKFSSPVLSDVEKARVFATYSALWGAGGWGLANQMMSVIEDNVGYELGPGERELITEGVLGMALEASWEGLTNSEANIDISEQVGALSGVTNDAKVALGLITGDKGLASERPGTPLGSILAAIGKVTGRVPGDLQEHFGPSVSFAATLGKAGQTVVETMGNPVLSTGETLGYQLHTLARAIPQYNSAYQGRLIMNTGKVLSRRGDTVAEATWSEGLIRSLAGLRSQEVDAVYDLQSKLQGSSLGREEASLREITQSGKDVASQIIALTAWKGDGSISREEAFNALGAHLSGIHIAYPDPVQAAHAKQVMIETLEKSVDSLNDGKTRFDEMIEIIVTDKALHREMGAGKMRKMLRELPDSKRKEALIASMDQFFKGSFEKATGTDE